MSLWLRRAEVPGKRKRRRAKAGRNSRHEFLEMFWNVADWLHELLPRKWVQHGNGSERLPGELEGLTSRARLLSRFLSHVLKEGSV
jgi:hypothetical protein